MTVFESIKQPKLAEIIAAQVRDEIRSGALAVGSRLPPERDLIELFGVSRGTLREALTLLQSQGFIDLQMGRNGGAYVTEPSVDYLVSILDVMLSVQKTPVWQLLEARALIEPIAADLACKRATEDDLKRMQTSIDKMERAADANDDDALRKHTVAFHVRVAEASHNELFRTLTAITQNMIFRLAHEKLVAEPRAAIASHHRILDAIRRRDSQVAALAMERHLRAFEKHVNVDRDGR